MDEPTTVLVVDDEEGMREGMRRVLERRGYRPWRRPRTAPTPWRCLAQREFDIALVDLKMPGIDGFQVTRAVTESGRETVVVIVSALATVEAAVEVTRHGAFDFLVKPFAPADLLQVIERAVKQRRLIGDRRTYLSELNKERTLSRQLINSLHDGVIVLNINAKPVLMNTARGVPPGRPLPGRHGGGGAGAGPVGHRHRPRDALPGRRTARTCGRSACRAGTPCCGSSSRRGGAARRPAALILLVTDVTDEWKTERDKNRFIGMVAHELTSPLSAIVGYIDVVLSGVLDAAPEKIHDVMRGSKTRAEALLDLVKDLQYLNRRDAGKIQRTVTRLDLRTVLEEQLKFFEAQAERAKVELVLRADLPALRLLRRQGGPGQDLHEPDLQRDQVQPRGGPAHHFACKARRRLRRGHSPTPESG